MKKKRIFNIVFVLLFSACSSAKSDGKDAAENLCDCEKAQVNNRVQSYSELIRKFNSYGFQTRIAVREKMYEFDSTATEKYNNCLQKAQDKYRKLNAKYSTDYKQAIEFNSAFEGYRAANRITDEAIEPLVAQIDDLLLTVNPPKPNLNKIKRDLVGRKITEQPNGYRRSGWYWKIEEGEIKEIQILDEQEQDGAYVFEIRMILQANDGADEVFAKLTYVLGKNDDWVIDFLESQQVNIVKTGKYNNCITAQIKGWSGEYELELTSNCDVALVVGGVVLPEFGNSEWQKFSTIVEPSGSKTVGGLFFVSVSDYKIHFIERPSTK